MMIADLRPREKTTIIGKVTDIGKVIDFDKGKVANVTVSDSTGSVKFTLWNDQIDLIDKLDVGDVIKIDGYVREDKYGLSLQLGKGGYVAKTDDVIRAIGERCEVRDLKVGEEVEIKVSVVQVFETNIFYGKDGLAIVCITDDGTGTIRTVFFNKWAEKLIGMDSKDAKEVADKKGVNTVLELVALGQELVLKGRVKMNEYFEQKEFIVNNVKSVDIQNEIDRLKGVLKNG